MEQNPYASPQTYDSDPAVQDSARDPKATQRLVRPPAIALCIVGGLGLLLDALNVFVTTIDAIRMLSLNQNSAVWTMIVVSGGGNLLITFLHVIVIVGGVKMYRLRGYSTAMAAAIICVLPFCSPLLFLGIPFGIWALIVLLLPDTRRDFRLRAVERNTAPKPAETPA